MDTKNQSFDNLFEAIKGIADICNRTDEKCANCKHFCNGMCMKSVNENRSLQGKMTTPNYKCNDFELLYEFNNDTKVNVNTLIDEMKEIKSKINGLSKLTDGAMREIDFNDICEGKDCGCDGCGEEE